MEGQGGLGTWRRYKVGQAQFTQWLKQTSEKVAARKQPTANPPEVTETPSAAAEATSSSKKKKKGKAKISVADINGASSDPASVHWSQLETMATIIVENADPEDIPEAPINILRDVVNLRKKSARFFARVANDTMDETIRARNSAHEHIINVLDRVLGKFEGLRSRVQGREKKEGGTVPLDDVRPQLTQYLEGQNRQVQTQAFVESLKAKGKVEILEDLRRDLPEPGQMSFIRQMAPLGLGHAVWCARHVIGDEPFAVMLPDMLMQASPPALAQMMLPPAGVHCFSILFRRARSSTDFPDPDCPLIQRTLFLFRSVLWYHAWNSGRS